MENEVKKKIEEMIKGLQCSKDFICYKSELENLCKAEGVGAESLLVCLEASPPKCAFALFLGDSYYCQCPIRNYIARNLEK